VARHADRLMNEREGRRPVCHWFNEEPVADIADASLMMPFPVGRQADCVTVSLIYSFLILVMEPMVACRAFGRRLFRPQHVANNLVPVFKGLFIYGTPPACGLV